MITIQENVVLAPFTTFGIGGVARYFTEASSSEDIVEALQYVKDHHIPVFILGGGSNVLFSDEGFAGLIIKLANTHIAREGNTLRVEAGALLGDVITAAIQYGLSGIELLSGIPGTIGGAIRGNAGAFGVEIGNVVTEVTFLDTKTLETRLLQHDECDFSYRDSICKQNPQLLVLSAKIVLQEGGDTQDMIRIASETIAKREAKHPQKIACAGSFFMNPLSMDENLLSEFTHDTGVVSRDGKIPAGWLIDHVGLRGKRVGGAQVSEIHPNYLINTGNATAEDVLILASIIKQRIRTQLHIQLKEELQMVGF